MPGVATVGSTGVPHVGVPKVNSGSPDVLVNGKACARVDDSIAAHQFGKKVHTSKIGTGNSTVLVNGRPIAIIGSVLVPSCTTLNTGSADVIA